MIVILFDDDDDDDNDRDDGDDGDDRGRGEKKCLP